MKITNTECFILENKLQEVVAELKESKVKNLSLNIAVKRNLLKATELCNDFRKEIQEFAPARLKELSAIEKLNKKEEKEKEDLNTGFNIEVNKFLQKSLEFEVFNCGVEIGALTNIELTYDTSNIIDFLFGEKSEEK